MEEEKGMKVQTGFNEVEVDGETVTYGRVPSALALGWHGIVLFCATSACTEVERHQQLVSAVLSAVEAASEDHCTYWDPVRRAVVLWKSGVQQITLVQYRVRDSY